MHLYFLVRGIKQQVALFEMFMQTQMFIWKKIDLKTKKEFVCQVQGALRVFPFGYEYVFPEECLDEVLTMLDFKNTMGGGLGKFKTFIIRNMIGKGLKPVPKKFKITNPNRYVEKRGLVLYPIGIKKDERKEMPQFGFNQELL